MSTLGALERAVKPPTVEVLSVNRQDESPGRQGPSAGHTAGVGRVLDGLGASFLVPHRDNSTQGTGNRGECPNGRWLIREVRGAAFIPCRGRLCSSVWCRRAWARRWSDLMAAALLGRVGYMLTVTAPGRLPAGYWSWDEWNATVPERFARLMRSLRRWMPECEYARVLELQKRGALHVHALVLGWRWVDLEAVRALVVAAGFGPRFEISEVRDGQGLARYLASKYLVKSHETLGRRYRVVQCSRGFPRTRANTDEDVWRRALNIVDPAVVLRDCESWWDWAERMGGVTVFDSRAGSAYWESGP